jgi:hypothetical protein
MVYYGILPNFTIERVPFATLRSESVVMEQSRLLGPSIGSDESVTFTMGYHGWYHYPCMYYPKTSNMQKLVVFGAL